MKTSHLWLACGLGLLLGLTGLGQEPPKKDVEPGAKKDAEAGAKLRIGNPAPALKASAWLRGEEVAQFEKGQIYVVEFWATWCGPCIVMMPHISQLQAEYRDRGVRIIGFSPADPNNTEQKVRDFLAGRGAKLQYTFAFANDRQTRDAYMKAAGRTGIPCCFVVDREGKIAFIGHPMHLGDVLAKLTAGTWKGEADAAAIEKDQMEMQAIIRLGANEPEKALAAYQDFRKKRPNLAKMPYYVTFPISLLMRLERFADARAEAENLMKEAISQENAATLQSLVSSLVTTKTKPDQALRELAVTAAEAAVKLKGENDGIALIQLAEAHFAAGHRAKAKEIGTKALEVIEPQLKPGVEKLIKKYDSESSEVK